MSAITAINTEELTAQYINEALSSSKNTQTDSENAFSSLATDL